MPSRRQFLKQTGLVSLAHTIPAFLRRTCQASSFGQEKILVVVELSGGNDGLNTLVPFRDDGYLANRAALLLEDASLLKLNDTLALNSAMRGMSKLYEAGELAIVQGVGYPNPNRSHDVSMSVWHSARMDPEMHRDNGWLGRGLDLLDMKPSIPSSITTVSGSVPNAIRGRKSTTASIESLNEFELPTEAQSRDLQSADAMQTKTPLARFLSQSAHEAYATAEQLRSLSRSRAANSESALSRLDSPLAGQLRVIADLIQADFGSQVYYAVQSGYDTHSRQLNDHNSLLATLSGSVAGFLKDLKATGNSERVMLMCFSEFGRQVKENASGGTDHGTAGPIFLAGAGVRGGIYGKPLDLNTLIDNAPVHTTDFRDVYAGVLRDWLGVAPNLVLDGYESVLSFV